MGAFRRGKLPEGLEGRGETLCVVGARYWGALRDMKRICADSCLVFVTAF